MTNKENKLDISLKIIKTMGFRYVFGATPAVETASLRLKLFNFLQGSQIKVSHSKLEPITFLWLSSLWNFWDFSMTLSFIPFEEIELKIILQKFKRKKNTEKKVLKIHRQNITRE